MMMGLSGSRNVFSVSDVYDGHYFGGYLILIVLRGAVIRKYNITCGV